LSVITTPDDNHTRNQANGEQYLVQFHYYYPCCIPMLISMMGEVLNPLRLNLS
jgi:hypothetical protein